MQIKENQRFITVFWLEEKLGTLPKALVGKERFKEGASSLEEAKKAFLLWEKRLAYKAAIRLLTKRDYYGKYLQLLLERKGCSTKAAKWAVEECKNRGYIDDERALNQLILRAIEQQQTPRYILQKLLQKQVPYGKAKSLLSDLYSEEKKAAVMEKMAQRKKKSSFALRAYFYQQGFFAE